MCHQRAKFIEAVVFQASGLADKSKISAVLTAAPETFPPISMILVSPGSSTDVSRSPRPPLVSLGPVAQTAVAGLKKYVVPMLVQATKPLVVSFRRG